MEHKHHRFSRQAMAEVAKIKEGIHLGNRVQMPGISIDLEVSKDLDDLIWIADDIVYVHIADPTAYVAKGSYLDQEASERLTTNYALKPPDPMLPGALSTNICSLLPGLARPGITIEIKLSPSAKVLDYQIYLSFVNNVARLSYAEADKILKNKNLLLHQQLAQLYEIALKLVALRKANGAIGCMDTEEGWLNEEGNLQPESSKFNTHFLIGEYAILANTLIANFLGDQPALFRNHVIDLSKLPEELQSLPLEMVIPYLKHQLDPAFYSTKPQRHFALAQDRYLHFTSPIRRYVDMINHRIIKALLQGQPSPYSESELEDIAQRATAHALTRKEAYKAQNMRIMAHKLKKWQLEHYLDLEPRKFSTLLGYAIKSDRLESLEEAIIARIDQLLPIDFYLLFFEASNFDIEQLRLNLLETISGETALMVLNIYNQIQQVNLEITVRQENNQFYSWAIAQGKTTKSPGISINKMESKKIAAKIYIKDYLQQQLTTDLNLIVPETLPPAPTSISDEDKHNWIGIINTYYQKNGLELPQYNFTQENGGFCCTVVDNNQTYQGQGLSKKEAKQNAAKSLAAGLSLIPED